MRGLGLRVEEAGGFGTSHIVSIAKKSLFRQSPRIVLVSAALTSSFVHVEVFVIAESGLAVCWARDALPRWLRTQSLGRRFKFSDS
jgi:hypothetical protein